VGASRKSFIGHVLGDKDASGARRLWGTAATSAIAVQQVSKRGRGELGGERARERESESERERERERERLWGGS
jgi:hypothetical protein